MINLKYNNKLELNYYYPTKKDIINSKRILDNSLFILCKEFNHKGGYYCLGLRKL